MKLEDYIKKKGWSQRYFAKKCGVHPSTITLWIQKKRMPQQKYLIKIFIHTQGEVTADDFYHA